MWNNTDRNTVRATTSLKAITLIVATACSIGLAHATERSGKEVVDTVCANCHASGKDGAPKIGDQADWSKRASKGLVNLTEHAITGVRSMPAHGGQAKLSDIEMSRAVAHMVSGGHSVDTNKAYASPQSRTGAQIVQLRCQECHATGKNGAPKIGEMSAWQPRLKNGVEPLVKSAINGHNSMPARGGMADLSDAEMRSAVTHIINQLSGTKK